MNIVILKNFTYLLFTFSSIILLTIIIGCNKQQDESKKSDEQMLERGKLLVTVGGCDDCHTPKNFGPKGPELNMSKRFSGHPEGTQLPQVDPNVLDHWGLMSYDLTAMVGPWGVSFGINLTPDDETGIGTWQPEMFINAMKTGKHLGVADGRPILPPMPWQNLAQVPDEDLNAIFMYLKSLPAVKNKTPKPMSLEQLFDMQKTSQKPKEKKVVKKEQKNRAD